MQPSSPSWNIFFSTCFILASFNSFQTTHAKFCFDTPLEPVAQKHIDTLITPPTENINVPVIVDDKIMTDIPIPPVIALLTFDEYLSKHLATQNGKDYKNILKWLSFVLSWTEDPPPSALEISRVHVLATPVYRGELVGDRLPPGNPELMFLFTVNLHLIDKQEKEYITTIWYFYAKMDLKSDLKNNRLTLTWMNGGNWSDHSITFQAPRDLVIARMMSLNSVMTLQYATPQYMHLWNVYDNGIPGLLSLVRYENDPVGAVVTWFNPTTKAITIQPLTFRRNVLVCIRDYFVELVCKEEEDVKEGDEKERFSVGALDRIIETQRLVLVSLKMLATNLSWPGSLTARAREDKYLQLTTEQLEIATVELTKQRKNTSKFREAWNQHMSVVPGRTQHLSVAVMCKLVKAASFRSSADAIYSENVYVKLDGEIRAALTLLKEEHNKRVKAYEADVQMGLIIKLPTGVPKHIHFQDDDVETMGTAVCSSVSVESLWELYNINGGLEEVVNRREKARSLKKEMANLLKMPDDSDNSLPSALAQKEETSYHHPTTVHIQSIHTFARDVLKSFSSQTLIWVSTEDPNVPTTVSTERPASDVVVHMLMTAIVEMYAKGQVNTRALIKYVEDTTAKILEVDRLSTDSTKSDDAIQVERQDEYTSSLSLLDSLLKDTSNKNRNEVISSLFSPIVAITRKKLIASLEAWIISCVAAVGHLKLESLDVVPAGNESDTSVVGVLHRLMKTAVEKLEAIVNKLAEPKYKMLTARLVDVGKDIREAVKNSESEWAIQINIDTKIALTALLMFLGGVAKPVGNRNSRRCLDQLADSLSVVGTYVAVLSTNYWYHLCCECLGDKVTIETLFRGVIHFWSWQLAHFALKEIEEGWGWAPDNEEGCTGERIKAEFEFKRPINEAIFKKQASEHATPPAEDKRKRHVKENKRDGDRTGVTIDKDRLKTQYQEAADADTRKTADYNFGILKNEADAYRNIAVELRRIMSNSPGSATFEGDALKGAASEMVRKMSKCLNDETFHIAETIMDCADPARVRLRSNLLKMVQGDVEKNNIILKDAKLVINNIIKAEKKKKRNGKP
eukprot:GHVS01056345.1.p1 GENE.GHVS01056345.1~~GHVS01056345.1.p1  ORF type:complete len:1079 (-),score=104.72 GHVS01056345.1:471-3707(-)